MRRRSTIHVPFTRALAALALIALPACASSTEPPGNGQSHWLDRCDDDSECGDLSCICGLCSIACTTDDACDEDRSLVCESARGLSTADQCEGAPGATMLCLSTELAGRRDAAVPDSGATDAAMDGAMMTDAAAVDAARGDAEVDAGDPGPPVVLPLDGFDVSCDAIEGDELAAEIRAYRSPFSDNFSPLSASEAGVAWGAGGTVHYMLEASMDVTSFIEAMYVPILDGTDLFYFGGAGAPTLTKRSLSGGDPVPLHAETDYSAAIALTNDEVYWAARDSGDSAITLILRTDRDSGDTIEVGRMRAQVPGSLAVLGGFAYFLHAPGSGNSRQSIARVALDGSEPVEVLTDPIDYLGNIISNGSSLFATISEVPAPEDPPPTDHRILRVEADGTVATLFETNRLWWYPSIVTIAADAHHIYWTALATPAGAARVLWRGRTDGTGEPEMVAHGLPEDSEHYIALSSSKLYYSTQCPSGIHVLSIDKPD